MRILVVEDSPSDFRLIRELLQDVSNVRFALTHVVLLSEALVLLNQEKFDVILLDLSLPDSHGLDTFNAMSEKASEIPIVIMSGFNDEMLAVKAVQKGAQDYLIKGQVTGSQLMRALRYSVERKGMEDALRKAYEILEKRMHDRISELEEMRVKIQEKDARIGDLEKQVQLSSSVIEKLMAKLKSPGFIWKDNEGRFLRANDQFAQTAGFQFVEELFAQHEHDLHLDNILLDSWRFREVPHKDHLGQEMGNMAFLQKKD